MARGKPWGFALPLYAGRVAGSATGADVAARAVATSSRSAARWAVRPADPPRGLIAQRAAALVSAAARGGRLEGSREREVGGQLHRARVLRAAVAPLVEGEAGLRRGLDGLCAALVEGAAARDATLAFVGRADRQRVFLRLRRAARVGGASVRVDGRGDIDVGLALLDGLEDGCLGRTGGDEVELGVGEEVAELAARLPADRDALDVLRAELLRRFRALAAERQGEIAELAEADLLALQQLLAHAVDCHVEDRHDVSAGVGRAVVGDVAGKLLDGHHLGVLCRGEVVGDDGLDECLVLGVGRLALGLGLVDTRLGLVDLEEIRVDGSCRDAVVDHCVKVFKGVQNGDLADGSLGPAPLFVCPSPLSQGKPVAGPLWVCSASLSLRCKGTKNISYFQIKSQIFSNFF